MSSTYNNTNRGNTRNYYVQQKEYRSILERIPKNNNKKAQQYLKKYKVKGKEHLVKEKWY